ncbi:MAG: DUF389 domain-containing protein [Candidatus Eremiobacteraeota bacterium]|nr:DUF389 domain-containing protein [Candidatus Eremiobacteraeota bacterium]
MNESQRKLVAGEASCAIATLGLVENSVAVIIGAMIVAPLITPIQAFAYASLAGDAVLVRRSLLTASAGAATAIAVSALLGLLIRLPASGSEILARTRPTVLDLGIAVAAGGIAGFAQVRPAIGNTVAGTAIAVALMPPLCVVGLALAAGQWSWAQGAGMLFGTNFLGIALSCMIVYVIGGHVAKHNRFALITTGIVTAALIVPLSASFYEIVREARIESLIRSELVTNTVVFRHVRLLEAHFDWYTKPVAVQLDVSSEQPVSSSQVADLQAFVARRTGQRVALTIRVTRYDTVTVSS